MMIAAASWHGTAAQQAPLDPVTPPTDAALALRVDDTTTSEWSRWTTGRYRITPGDVIEINFTFVPELNQMVTVQPDGYVTLRDIRDLRAQGRTVTQFEEDVRAAYAEFLLDPALSIALKEFEAPYFVAAGEVQRPGRYEMRGALTVTQAIAVAGGFTDGAKASEVALYRSAGVAGPDVTRVNVSRMYARKDLSEDPLLRPGDTIVVGRSLTGKLSPLTSFFNLWWLW
jgi:polysaccharide export outer membrane protein